MRRNYDTIRPQSSLQDVIKWIADVTRNRLLDVEDYKYLTTISPEIFSPPSSSSDLVGTEKAGDMAADTNYLYVVVNNAGTLQWRRVAISTF